MNYELAKKLKDAGFPQTYLRGSWACKHGIHEEMDYVPCLSVDCWGDNLSYAPTLEELIEACGDRFDCLGRVDYPKGENLHWNAYRTEESYDGDCVVDCCGYETGDTPTEAVANLWLALNTK